MKTKTQKISLLDSVLINVEPENLVAVSDLCSDPSVKKFFADTELVLTAQTFFDHDLNLIKTSAALIVHRNTLLYRLNKINNLLGLDIRKFDDAVTLAILISFRRTEIKRKRHVNRLAQLENFR